MLKFRRFLGITVLLILVTIGAMGALDQYQIHARAEAAKAEYASLPLCPKEIAEAPAGLDRDLGARAANCRL